MVDPAAPDLIRGVSKGAALLRVAATAVPSRENGCALAGRTGSLRQTVTTQPPVRPGERASSGDSRVNDTRS